MTREMLDGLDNFWRARMWDDLSKLPPAERAKALPYIYQWAESGAKLSGVDVISGFNATMAIRAAAAKLFCDIDYVISPVSPVVNFAAELASPINDPDKPFEHIGYTVPWNMSENPAASINGGYRQRRAFRSACRSSAAASTISACSAWPRRSRACAARRGRGRARRRSNAAPTCPSCAEARPAHPRLVDKTMDCRACCASLRLAHARNDDDAIKNNNRRGNTQWPTRRSNTRSPTRSSPSR